MTIVLSHMMIIQEFVFEVRSGVSEFDHPILALLKQQRGRPENYRQRRAQGSNPRSDLNTSGLSRRCLSSAKIR